MSIRERGVGAGGQSAYTDFHRTVVKESFSFCHCFILSNITRLYNDKYAHCASFPSFMPVLLISLAIAFAILVNSDFPSPSFPCSKRCFASDPRCGNDDLFRMDSTQARNSLVRSWTGMVLQEYRIKLAYYKNAEYSKVHRGGT